MIDQPIIHLNSLEQDLAHRIALARNESAKKNKIKNCKIGGMTDYQTDLEGFAAELAVCKHYGCYPDLQIDVRPDFDLLLPCGLTVDVKATKYVRGHLLVVRWKVKKKLPNLFALVVGSFPGPYRLCGFILSKELLIVSRLKDFGYGNGYAAKQSELYDLDEALRRVPAKEATMDQQGLSVRILTIPDVCQTEGCVGKRHCRGYCLTCYNRLRKKKLLPNAIKLTPEERFWTKVTKTSDCWFWHRDGAHGYGVIRWNGRQRLAHRIAYELAFGPIPKGLQIDHICRNRLCVNPSHLEAVTPRENTLRSEAFSAKNARKIECVNGHAFTPENVSIINGQRRCKTCVRNRSLVYSRKNRESLNAKRREKRKKNNQENKP